MPVSTVPSVLGTPISTTAPKSLKSDAAKEVKKTEKLFEEFYADNGTSFVFTADHGMSVIGNHGDGGTSAHYTQITVR